MLVHRAAGAVYFEISSPMSELQIVEAALPHGWNARSAARVLVRLDVPRVEHELVVQLESLPNLHHIVLARLDREASSRVVDDVDLPGLCPRSAGCRAWSFPRPSDAARAARPGNGPFRVEQRDGVRQYWGNIR
jgi:hypothetical protein